QAERREARLKEQDPGDYRGAERDRAAARRAEREARRAERAGTDGAAASETSALDSETSAPQSGASVEAGRREPELDPAAEAQVAAAAPPETTGRSDTVVESPPPAPEVEADDSEVLEGDHERTAEPAQRERGKVAAFLVAVWAELRRVQWPDRKTLTTLTGVVLGFVVLAGGYLGLLDAIFSRVIDALI
ncbi:MAG TPA: preprotein translocase subunit SecE, partial [Thermoleophilaceae bacterium]|nr:preprotein translocase subunit SecE [Thermoleophilaceae bacterium]